jgi:hypothetical protein
MSGLLWLGLQSEPYHFGNFLVTNSLPKIQSDPVECPGLDDQLCASLKHVELCPHGGHLVDGISYALHVRTSAVSADLTFSSPKTESLRGVARALFATAESVARITARQDMTDYLKIWRRYI